MDLELKGDILDKGGINLSVYPTGKGFEFNLRFSPECDLVPSSDDYDVRGGNVLQEKVAISEEQALELIQLAGELLDKNWSSRDDLEDTILRPLSDAIFAAEDAHKREMTNKGKVDAAANDVKARILYESKFRGEEVVNGIQIQVSWFTGRGDTKLQTVENGQYEFYLPGLEVDSAQHPGISDQVIVIGRDTVKAERVMAFAKEAAASAKDVYELYRLVLKEMNRL